MKIDRNLNLVIPLVREDGTDAYVHSIPIGAEAFDKYFYVIAKTFAAIFMEGFGPVAGPRIAHKLLKKICLEQGRDVWADVERGFLADTRRLTSVIYVGKTGWESLPFDDAVKARIVDPQDEEEVTAALTFFTVSWLMHKRADRGLLEVGMGLWGARLEPLSCTELMRSLPTSTPDESSGAKVVSLAQS